MEGLKLKEPDRISGWMKNEDGSPMPDALPNFIVLIQNEKNVGKEYRKAVDTFDEP